MRPHLDVTPDAARRQLLTRRKELERRMRQPGGIRIIEERELLQLRAQLGELPDSAPATDGSSPTRTVQVTPSCDMR